MSNDRLADVRALISTEFPASVLPAEPRLYKSKVKNAQEAHEAISVVRAGTKPDAVHGRPRPQRMLYELIWRRSVACQMKDAVFRRVRSPSLLRPSTSILQVGHHCGSSDSTASLGRAMLASTRVLVGQFAAGMCAGSCLIGIGRLYTASIRPHLGAPWIPFRMGRRSHHPGARERQRHSGG